jgi:hypothetical protein
MGTRGCIAKPEGDGWRGRYHHWDSYPTGLGLTLLAVHADTFHGDTDAMIAYLIDEEPVGWSTINGAEWSLPKGWHDSHDRDGKCAVCGLEMWRHYRQYYPEGGPNDPMVNGKHRTGLLRPNETMQLGHTFEEIRRPQGPQSYSARGETNEMWITSEDTDTGGAEWCYVICGGGLLVLEGDYGAFGMGGGNWKNPELVAWGDDVAMRAIEDRVYAKAE